MAKWLWLGMLLGACDGGVGAGAGDDLADGDLGFVVTNVDAAVVDDASVVDGTVADAAIADAAASDMLLHVADMNTSCGTCNQPPTSCHSPVGNCVAGRCVYTLVDGLACDDGNACTVGDSCSGGVCAGTPRVCNSPPAAACISGTDLLSYDAVGVCNAGACVYTHHDVVCGAGGCAGNACSTDPCTGITCQSPPSLCFKSTGTCGGGACSYGFADGVACNDSNPCTDTDQCNSGVCKGKPKACVSPPADQCDDANTLRSYDSVGSCGAGACSYSYHFTTCAAGCASNRCNATAWTTQSSGVNVSLHGVWGASGSDVFAVGDIGTILRGNGTTWKTMPVPQGTGNLVGVDGTASNNVFAVTQDDTAEDGDVLRFDGTSWSKRGTVSCGDFCCVGAIGPDDVYTWNYGGQLARITGGVTKSVASVSVGTTLFHQCTVKVISATDVYIGGGLTYHFDGTKITELKATTSFGSYGLVAFGPTQVLSFAYGNVGRWDGTQWLSVPTGQGTLYGMGGSAFTNVFAVGAAITGGTAAFWDGTGWSGETLPAHTPTLQGVWVATTGEVYVVGSAGTILKTVR